MLFYNLDPSFLTPESQFFHNVLIICIAISPQIWTEQCQDIWYLDELTGARPYAVHLFVDDQIDEEFDWEVIYATHCVLQLSPDGSVTWFDNLDETKGENPWI